MYSSTAKLLDALEDPQELALLAAQGVTEGRLYGLGCDTNIMRPAWLDHHINNDGAAIPSLRGQTRATLRTFFRTACSTHLLSLGLVKELVTNWVLLAIKRNRGVRRDFSIRLAGGAAWRLFDRLQDARFFIGHHCAPRDLQGGPASVFHVLQPLWLGLCVAAHGNGGVPHAACGARRGHPCQAYSLSWFMALDFSLCHAMVLL